MKSIFPYFGAKGRAAHLVWQHLGSPECYIEPFAGSLAVLLARPDVPKVEIVGDLDALLTNFWRAIAWDWPGVQRYLIGPISEIDLRAKHSALLAAREPLTEKMVADPDYYDARLAAWWWQGISSWLGSGFGHRLSKQRPHIDRSLKGCWANGMTDDRVAAVAARLADVIILAGDWQEAWKRPATTAIINRFHRSVGVFLDPPYAGDRQKGLYSEDQSLTEQITDWCLAQPAHVRIVVAGYDDEYPALREAGWSTANWKAPNGYAQNGNQRRHQETLYVNTPVVRKRRLIRSMSML